MTELARRNLIDFEIAIDPNYDPNWHHELIAEKLMAVERGDIRRLAVFVPPRHGKSRQCSIDFPAWYLGRNPTGQIITSSYSAELSKDFGEATRDLLNLFEYQRIFPLASLKQDSTAKDKWQTDLGGYYISVGVGGAITGRGANIAIIDDPFKNREEANSPTIREKVYNWYTSTLYTRLEPNGAIILIMTRWHDDDLAGRILHAMEEADGEKWDVVSLPAIAEHDEEYRKAGEALWPKRYELPELERIRTAIGPKDWSSLYQQHPILVEQQEFREETFNYFDESDLLGKQLNFTIAVDPAISQKDSADRTGITVVGKELGKPDWYVLEAIGHRMNPLELIDAVFSLYNEYRKRGPVKVGIETVAYQESLLFFMAEEMKRREEYIQIQGLKNTGNKEERIRGLVPLFNTGVMHLRKTHSILIEEAITFPSGRTKDVLDSLSFHLELQAVTSRRSRHRTGGQQLPHRERNPITGY